MKPIEHRSKYDCRPIGTGVEAVCDIVPAAPAEGVIARFETVPPGEVVLFLVGMRINRWSRSDRWWPALGAMRTMWRQLRREPEAGLLTMTATGFSNPFVFIQYWQSERHLFDFAHSPRFPKPQISPGVDTPR